MRLIPRPRPLASSLLLLVGLAASACSGGSGHSASSSTSTSTSSVTSTTVPAAKVTFTPTGDFVGLTFQSYEGEISPSAGLQVLDQGCFDVPVTGTCAGSWLVLAPKGTYLLVATSTDFTFTVKHAYAVAGVPAGSALQFAEGSSGQTKDGGTIALVRGTSDPSFHWTDIAGAWTVSLPDGGAVAARPTAGLTAFDSCASYDANNGLQPAQCPTPSTAPG